MEHFPSSLSSFPPLLYRPQHNHGSGGPPCSKQRRCQPPESRSLLTYVEVLRNRYVEVRHVFEALSGISLKFSPSLLARPSPRSPYLPNRSSRSLTSSTGLRSFRSSSSFFPNKRSRYMNPPEALLGIPLRRGKKKKKLGSAARSSPRGRKHRKGGRHGEGGREARKHMHLHSTRERKWEFQREEQRQAKVPAAALRRGGGKGAKRQRTRSNFHRWLTIWQTFPREG